MAGTTLTLGMLVSWWRLPEGRRRAAAAAAESSVPQVVISPGTRNRGNVHLDGRASRYWDFQINCQRGCRAPTPDRSEYSFMCHQCAVQLLKAQQPAISQSESAATKDNMLCCYLAAVSWVADVRSATYCTVHGLQIREYSDTSQGWQIIWDKK